jgi:exopolysaccharide biosynthesis predicted pyruvyltransferase EpsI
MKVSEDKIVSATDFSFFLSSKIKKYALRKGIILALRREDISKQEKKELKILCQVLQKQYKKVELLPMQSHQTNDEKLAKELSIPLVKLNTLRSVRTQITCAQYVLTNRLHGAILSMLSGTPFLAVASRPKISDFLKSADLSDMVYAKKLTAVSLKKIIEKTLDSPEKMQKLIRTSVKKEKKKTDFLLPDFF